MRVKSCQFHSTSELGRDSFGAGGVYQLMRIELRNHDG
jgi:hypothetical protein